MLLGESLHRSISTVQIPLWEPLQDPTSSLIHPTLSNAVNALQRYLPSDESDSLSDDDEDSSIDAFSRDHFRMYEFKVRRCARARSHDWTECPFAHPGEKARRRDPLRYNYSGTPCPEYKNGGCKKRDTCEFAHGVFECWLHPTRYRTQPCKDGTACRRRVCFFAHTPEQLRVLDINQSPKSSRRYYFHFESPRKIQIESFSSSPVMSPTSEISSCSQSFEDAMRGLHVDEVSWGFESGSGTSGFGSLFRFNEEPEMERVESGKELREKMYQKLSKEFSLNRVNSMTSLTDVDCVTELVK